MDSTNSDCHGHGTHVAGTIGGKAHGVAKQVRLTAVKVLDCDGSGSYSAVIAGIDWVTANAQKPRSPT
ncbi:S8 family serine peptidase [Actinokineospora soli]|uniref:S8 family serine peptidase n=1 Tax=Actinokineospora soli TaxID=1048753 RepID=A0ABW2TRA2_9PSEU